MGFKALITLWLVPALTLTKQEMVAVNVSPHITAECGKPVILRCNVTSKSPDELEVKIMEWSQNKMLLCSVNSSGEITTQNKLSPFRCEYKDQQLSLIFQNVQPMESGRANPYMCKLKSNQGAAHAYSRLELEECCGTVEPILTSREPGCTFTHVHPDGDVHWFLGSRLISDGSLQNVSKRVEDGGWLTISSYLDRPRSDVPYNCSLKSTTSDRYIASTLVTRKALFKNLRGDASSLTVTSLKMILYISVSLIVTVK
ncbi:hypothetical protein Q5P01_025045 [Channa striata]|uniref:Ig-like domain-containing protein n=1 Tax=Channa striata TaxID=64152 RepID=A0AA88LHW6_CHASR|nr:hypothetical protein Q5P01_025045 [Channa striata]